MDELPAPERPDATKSAVRSQNFGIVLTAVGIGALGTGFTLYLAGLAADRPDDAPVDEQTKKTAWLPYLDGRTAGVVVSF